MAPFVGPTKVLTSWTLGRASGRHPRCVLVSRHPAAMCSAGVTTVGDSGREVPHHHQAVERSLEAFHVS